MRQICTGIGEQVETYEICINQPARALRVWTGNTLYEIEVTDAARQRVVIRGGSRFGEARAARIAGARTSAGALWHGSISVGRRLEIHVDGYAILTSPVRYIEIPPLTAASVTHT